MVSTSSFFVSLSGRGRRRLTSRSSFCSIADGSRPDDDCVRDPVDEVLSILAASEDAALVRKYGLWVVKRDWERGLEVSRLLSSFRITSNRTSVC